MYQGQRFSSSLESLMAENFLLLTNDVTVELDHRYLQQLHLLALHLELQGYIPGLLNELEYLRRIGKSIGDNLSFKLLRKMLRFNKPLRLPKEAHCTFQGFYLNRR